MMDKNRLSLREIPNRVWSWLKRQTREHIFVKRGWYRKAAPRSDFWVCIILLLLSLLLLWNIQVPRHVQWTFLSRRWGKLLVTLLVLVTFYILYPATRLETLVEKVNQTICAWKWLPPTHFLVRHPYKLIATAMIILFLWGLFGTDWQKVTLDTAQLARYHHAIMPVPAAHTPQIQIYLDYPRAVKRADVGAIRIGVHNPVTDTKITSAKIRVNDGMGLLHFNSSKTEDNVVEFAELLPGTTHHEVLSYTVSSALDYKTTMMRELPLSLWVEYAIISPCIDISPTRATTPTIITMPLHVAVITPSMNVYPHAARLEQWQHTMGGFQGMIESASRSIQDLGVAIAALIAAILAFREELIKPFSNNRSAGKRKDTS